MKAVSWIFGALLAASSGYVVYSSLPFSSPAAPPRTPGSTTAVAQATSHANPKPAVDPARLQAAREAAWAKVQPELTRARDLSNKASKQSVAAVLNFFGERGKRTKDFAQAVFSLRSKWEYLRSCMPYAKGDEHRRYLREQFEKTVFSQKELEQVLTSAMTSYFESVRGIENDLLVKIRADLADSDLAGLQADNFFGSDKVFREAYTRLLDITAEAMVKDLKVVVGREVVAWVAMDLATQLTLSVATQVGARLGLSTAVLTTGASSGVVTVGVGIAAGLLIDSALEWILKAVGYDPESDLAEALRDSVEDVGNWLVMGDRSVPPIRWTGTHPKPQLRKPWSPPKSPAQSFDGLTKKLLDIYEQREVVRTAALKKLILEGGK